jgi:hypothetical protein
VLEDVNTRLLILGSVVADLSTFSVP